MELSTSLSSLFPCLIALAIGQIIVRVYSPNSVWARTLIVSVSFVLTLRYLWWRAFYTLNLSNRLTTVISLFILGLEIFAWIMPYLNLFMSIQRKQRHREADFWEESVKRGDYLPTVDILIPTYNESAAILRRTIIGAQAIAYKSKKVYLLDDGEREEIRILARELGCNYIARKEHYHAKAGNLNHALKLTNGELIAIFDADFVASRNFLTRSVGFFQKSQLALLQTHQHFFNQDAVARNLGLGNILGHPVEEFSARLNQPMRDYHNSVMCFGSSFVVRRIALESVGGFFTNSITEDYFTGIKLLAKKWQINYLNERLSAGLVPENIPALFSQRMRWAKGTIQGFFVSANPLTIKGLNLAQRLIYTTGIIHWFTNVSLAIFIFTIPLFFMLKLPPFIMTFEQWLAFFLPFLLFELSIFFWLGDRSSSKIVIDIYSFILCFPITIAIIETLIKPFATSFRVTPKGIATRRSIFRWRYGLPIIYTWIITVSSLGIYSRLFSDRDLQQQFITNFKLMNTSLEIALFWSVYYLILLSICILALIDKSKVDLYPWLNIKTAIDLLINGQKISGLSQSMSETGIKLSLHNDYSLPIIKKYQKISLKINQANLVLKGTVKSVEFKREKVYVQLEYSTLTIEQYRQLVSFLFCEPNRWKTPKVPADLKALPLLIKTIFVRVKQIVFVQTQKSEFTTLNLQSESVKLLK